MNSKQKLMKVVSESIKEMDEIMDTSASWNRGKLIGAVVNKLQNALEEAEKEEIQNN